MSIRSATTSDARDSISKLILHVFDGTLDHTPLRWVHVILILQYTCDAIDRYENICHNYYVHVHGIVHAILQ